MQGGATGLVLVAGPQALGALASATMPPHIEWAMTDAEGRLVAGRALPARGATSRASATTGLPWTLHVFEPIGYTPPAGSSRRRLLIFVIASVATLLAIGWYFIWRGVSREVRLARLQSDFVAAVSHEFRSPLTSLRHIGDLLAENRLPTEEQKQRSYAVLTHETDRLGRLVESLLDFARFESGSAVLRLSPTSIANVVRSVVADFQIRPDAGSRSMLVPHSLPDLMVNIDRDAVARALWNLLDNAVKYSPPDSTIWIGVSATADGRSACVSVRDEGIGIPSHEQRTVFDRFVRGREATSRRIQGTGIGLALVREIMRAHHGSVAVESEPGAGSTFTLVLPQADDIEPHAASSHDAGLLAGVSGSQGVPVMARVLVVEDEPAIAFALEADLRSEGHGVSIATSGDQAVDLARSEEFDLILLDVMLPGKDGFEVCRELRRGGMQVGDHRAHRPDPRCRKSPRPRTGRGRLRHQAVQSP